MKLFFFNPNTYGTEAFVMAGSKEKVIEYLENSANLKENIEFYGGIVKRMVNSERYTIDEFNVGEVIWDEIC